jgi:hypothetical protein
MAQRLAAARERMEEARKASKLMAEEEVEEKWEKE